MLPRKRRATTKRKPPKPGTRKKAAPKKKGPSPVEDRFLTQILAAGLPEPVREFAFDVPKTDRKKRRWRYDMAWPELKLAVEVEGGVWGGRYCRACKQRQNGRHNSPVGFEKDCEKYGYGVAQGWQILRVTSKMVKGGMGIDLLVELFAERKAA